MPSAGNHSTVNAKISSRNDLADMTALNGERRSGGWHRRSDTQRFTGRFPNIPLTTTVGGSTRNFACRKAVGELNGQMLTCQLLITIPDSELQSFERAAAIPLPIFAVIQEPSHTNT